MKLKELLAIMRSAREENTTFTLVDYEIYNYLDGSEKETVCSFSSDFKPECFLKDSILEAEVIGMGMKSETEMVFRLADDWDKEKEEQKIVDVRCPSKALDVSITKNEFGFSDVTIRDLEEDDMIEMLKNICLQFNVSGIVDKDGKWSYSFTDNNQTFTDEGM
jgi:hypothetical protein